MPFYQNRDTIGSLFRESLALAERQTYSCADIYHRARLGRCNFSRSATHFPASRAVSKKRSAAGLRVRPLSFTIESGHERTGKFTGRTANELRRAHERG